MRMKGFRLKSDFNRENEDDARVLVQKGAEIAHAFIVLIVHPLYQENAKSIGTLAFYAS